MSLPIVFIHRDNEAHVGICMQQAKFSNPSSRVILIGSPGNKQLCGNNIEHFLLTNYNQSAQIFSTHYKHSSPITSYAYNLFCFLRWFVLRDFMRSQGFERCWYFDSDVMLYSDLSKMNTEEFPNFEFEYSWTTVCELSMLDQFCDYVTIFFREHAHYQMLLAYAKEHGDVPVSDMILFVFFHNYALRRSATYGMVADGFFDHNLNCPFPPFAAQINSLDNKKQVYQKDGTLFCKFTDKNDYLKAHSLHFQGHAKAYIPYFRSQVIPNTDYAMYFDYTTCTWVRADS
ncbi:hypothetical protein [Brevibacillus sp. 179-C9.3 HS]|uniref:hypothetical protein n=1 Tax=unclassified Brevibacillus TaxID=2684853 RepID=UPI0039A00D7A